jgi:hypothetical protein
MKRVINDLKLKERHAALPGHLKFRYFFTMNKRRFFYMFFWYLVWKYGARVRNWFREYRIKKINKYKRRWLSRYNPEAVTY